MKQFTTILLIFTSFIKNQKSFSQIIQGPNTLCIKNELQLSTTDTTASTYYWGFCSAYLNNIPTGSSIAAGTGMDAPASICMVTDSSNYYVFVVNTNSPRNLLRYDFGTSMSNAPTVNVIGDSGGTIPVIAKGFAIVKSGANWYGFLV